MVLIYDPCYKNAEYKTVVVVLVFIMDNQLDQPAKMKIKENNKLLSKGNVKVSKLAEQEMT